MKDWGLHPIIEHFTLEDIFERLQNGELEGASRVSLEIPDHAVFTCLIAPSTKAPFQTVFNSAKVGDIVEFGKYLKYLIRLNARCPAPDDAGAWTGSRGSRKARQRTRLALPHIPRLDLGMHKICRVAGSLNLGELWRLQNRVERPHTLVI